MIIWLIYPLLEIAVGKLEPWRMLMTRNLPIPIVTIDRTLRFPRIMFNGLPAFDIPAKNIEKTGY